MKPDAFARDDVRDRTIVLGLERRETFRAEQDIVDQTLAQRPAFWAYVLARLPSVIKALAGHRPAQLTHRLADFAQFCVAIGPALGYPVKDVLAGLDAVDGERNSFAADTSNVLRALQFWAELQQATHKANQYAKSKAEQRPFNFQCVRQRPTDVFMAVKDAWPEKMGRFPFNKVETFGYALKNEEPMLRSYFRITREMGRSNSRLITIEQVRDRDEKR